LIELFDKKINKALRWYQNLFNDIPKSKLGNAC